MSKNFDSKQTEHRSTLSRLSDSEKPTLKEILPQINAELIPVFELRASSTPDLVLNIGPGSIKNTDTGLTRSFSPIDQQYFEFLNGSVTFPSANGGTIDVSVGVDSLLVMADDTYMACLVQINSIGELSVAQGIAVANEADVTLAINFPVPNTGELPIGYVVLQNIAGVIQPIENEKIVQFESGGGGSGSGDAVGFESEMDDYLQDSFFEYYTAIVLKRDKEELIDEANSTGDFANADGVYDLDTGEVFTSINLFDSEFIARDIKSLFYDVVVDYFDDASIDLFATYEVSIDGGVSYEPITMSIMVGTTRFLGRIQVSDNATYDDLRLRITSSQDDRKLSNIAIFYNEIKLGVIGGIFQSQTFAVNGDDDQIDFVLTKFLPDPLLTKMYVEETGQVFKGSSLSISGFTVSVPTGTFDAPGETYTITIEQTEGNTFDNSDENSARIAQAQVAIADLQKSEMTNRVINGGMDFWQQDNVSVALDATPTYRSIDMFLTSANISFTTPTIERSTILPSGSGSEFSMLFNGTANASDAEFNVIHRIEDKFIRDLNGKTVYVKCKVRSNNLTNLDLIVSTADVKNDFSAVSAEPTISKVITDDDVWQTVSFQVSLPATSVRGAQLQFNANGRTADVATDFYIAEISLSEVDEERFRTAGKDYMNELELCQRYFSKTKDLEDPADSVSSPGRVSHRAYANASKRFSVRLQTRMRTNPIVTINNATIAWFVTTAGETNIDFQSNDTGSGFYSFQFYCDARL